MRGTTPQVRDDQHGERETSSVKGVEEKPANNVPRWTAETFRATETTIFFFDKL